MKISSLGRANVLGTLGIRFDSGIFKHKRNAPRLTAIAQQDRASDYESEG